MHVLPTSPRIPHAVAPLTDPSVCEEQTPLQSRSKVQDPIPTPSELPFSQQEIQSNLFGPLTIDPYLPPDVLIGQSPAADPHQGGTTLALGVCL